MDYKKIELLLQYAAQIEMASLGLETKTEKKVKAAYEIVEKELGIDVQILKSNAPTKDSNKALVIFIQDTTGSMGVWEKAVSKEYFELAQEEIKKKYSYVDIKYIGFDTKCTEFSSLEDAQKSTGGGTIASSGLKKANNIILNNLDKNIYVFLFSDGDNLPSDCSKSKELIKEILEYVNYFQYIETNQYNRTSTLGHALRGFSNKKFNNYIIKQKNDALAGIRFKEVLEKEGK